MELHSTCGSNSLRQTPILIQLIHTRQEESFLGWMVATDPSEDAELPTTRLRATSTPCLGLILRCLSFLRSLPFMVYVSLYRQSSPIYPFMVTPLMWTLPLWSSRLFPIVLRCITNLLFPWCHIPFVLTYSSFTWSRISLTDHSHPPSCLCSSFRPDYSEIWLIPIV